jgi:hypothetical protein
MNVAINAIFANVPNPGLSRSGIQKRRTHTEITAVEIPKAQPVFIVSPCAKTVQGAFPVFP